MINLIKNELFKLTHRVETYVLIIFAILVTIVINLMNYYFSQSNEKIYKQELESIIEMNEDLKNSAQSNEEKASYYAEIDMCRLKFNYPVNSAEKGYIDGKLNDLSNTMYYELFANGADSESYIEAKREYDEALDKLNHFDWKQEIKTEIQEYQNMIDILSDSETISASTQADINYHKEIVRVLNYRLENNIPVDGSNASDNLEEYLENLGLYNTINKESVDYNEQVYKRQVEETIGILKYKIDNRLIQEDKNNNGYTTISRELVSIVSGESFLLVFVAIFIASMIIPMEFEKGTIRQLLVKPYTRTEILVSKIISTILYFIGFMLFYLLINIIVLGLFVGFSTIAAPIVIYHFNTSQALQVALVPYLLKCFVLVLPRFLLTMFIVNLFAIITKSIVLSMYIGLMLNVIDLSFIQKPISKFWLPNCWDFNVFANGGISINKYVTLPSSIVVVCVVTVVVLLLSNIIFQKKEIKNQ